MASNVSSALAQGSYSRELETEADDFSYYYAQYNIFDPIHFANIMQRMIEESGVSCKRENNIVHCGSETANKLEGFLSTHPVSEARIQRFLDLHIAQQK